MHFTPAALPTRTYSHTFPWMQLWDSGLRISDVFPGPKSHGRVSHGIVWDKWKKIAREKNDTHAPCVPFWVRRLRLRTSANTTTIPLSRHCIIKELEDMLATCTTYPSNYSYQMQCNVQSLNLCSCFFPHCQWLENTSEFKLNWIFFLQQWQKTIFLQKRMASSWDYVD